MVTLRSRNDWTMIKWFASIRTTIWFDGENMVWYERMVLAFRIVCEESKLLFLDREVYILTTAKYGKFF